MSAHKLHDISHLNQGSTAKQTSNPESGFAKDFVYSVSELSFILLSFKKR